LNCAISCDRRKRKIFYAVPVLEDHENIKQMKLVYFICKNIPAGLRFVKSVSRKEFEDHPIAHHYLFFENDEIDLWEELDFN